MKDRIPTYPGRIRLIPVPGQDNVYDLQRADEPTEVGTPLNKANLLTDATAALFGFTQTDNPNIDDVFDAIYSETNRIGEIIKTVGDKKNNYYIWCDGRKISQQDYPELFNILDYTVADEVLVANYSSNAMTIKHVNGYTIYVNGNTTLMIKADGSDTWQSKNFTFTGYNQNITDFYYDEGIGEICLLVRYLPSSSSSYFYSKIYKIGSTPFGDPVEWQQIAYDNLGYITEVKEVGDYYIIKKAVSNGYNVYYKAKNSTNNYVLLTNPITYVGDITYSNGRYAICGVNSGYYTVCAYTAKNADINSSYTVINVSETVQSSIYLPPRITYLSNSNITLIAQGGSTASKSGICYGDLTNGFKNEYIGDGKLCNGAYYSRTYAYRDIAGIDGNFTNFKVASKILMVTDEGYAIDNPTSYDYRIIKAAKTVPNLNSGLTDGTAYAIKAK